LAVIPSYLNNIYKYASEVYWTCQFHNFRPTHPRSDPTHTLCLSTQCGYTYSVRLVKLLCWSHGVALVLLWGCLDY
jgi:hypothetical protein